LRRIPTSPGDCNYWVIELLEHQEKERDLYWDMLNVFTGKFELPDYKALSAIRLPTSAEVHWELPASRYLY
jgi:hypothetical protein